MLGCGSFFSDVEPVMLEEALCAIHFRILHHLFEILENPFWILDHVNHVRKPS